MLCLQQCIDLCDLTPEQAQAVRERATLAEIVAIQAECAHAEAAAAGNPLPGLPPCKIRDMRDELLAELEAAQDFADLDQVAQHYCAYLDARDGRAIPEQPAAGA